MLKRLPGPPPCGPKWMEKATRDILSSLRSHLQRGRSCKAGRGPMGGLPWPFHGPATKQNHILRPKGGMTYMIKPSRMPGKCPNILEMNIERLNRAANSTKCWHPCSCSSSWGRLQERCVWSPNLHRLKRHATFCESEEGTSSDERSQREPWGHSTRGEVEEGDLGPIHTLRPELECFLAMPTTSWGTRDRQGFPLEPSIKDCEQWLEWWACQLDTPYWWEELTTILGAEGIKKLAWKICTSFDIPAVWYEVLRSQGYTVPPALKCLKGGMFLPDDLLFLDIQLKPQQMALAYMQALQYWAEEANLLAPSEPCPLAMSVR